MEFYGRSITSSVLSEGRTTWASQRTEPADDIWKMCVATFNRAICTVDSRLKEAKGPHPSHSQPVIIVSVWIWFVSGESSAVFYSTIQGNRSLLQMMSTTLYVPGSDLQCSTLRDQGIGPPCLLHAWCLAPRCFYFCLCFWLREFPRCLLEHAFPWFVRNDRVLIPRVL